MKLKKQFSREIEEKNNLINELKFKEKIFMSVLAEKQNISHECSSNTAIKKDKYPMIDFGSCRS